MPLTAEDFSSLADQFSGLARSILAFETNNPNLSDTDFHTIDRLRMTALDYSDHFLVAAIQQTLQNLNVPLQQISSATTTMNTKLKTLANIGKAISIATAGIQLGAAIMTGQLPAIGQAIAGLTNVLSN
jgi:hypothetical protein